MPAKAKALTEITPDRKLRYHFHPGQWRAWESTKRIVCVLAGTRGGKTSFGPPWLHREMLRKGPGDYLVAAPTYQIIDKAAGPEIKHYFERLLQLGRMKTHPLQFVFSPAGQERLWGRRHDRGARIIFGHADDPESLEAMNAKAAWLDEPGQKRFRIGSWEACQRRLALDQGRVLMTTTPYGLGWLKTLILDPWQAAKRQHVEIEVVRFASIMNPTFPREEFERARASLPGWKFRMFYEGLFERPPGQIYDVFNEKLHKVPRFRIPNTWPRYLGLDFGGVNTAGVFLAEEPESGRLYAYREYKAGGRTAGDHAEALLAGEPGLPITVGGSKSEGQWRDEFCAAGLPVREPAVKEVEVGIDRVYGRIKKNELYLFEDLAGVLDELGSYARVLDDFGEPTEEIEDKESYHFLDACRYIVGWLHSTGPVEFGSDRGSLIEQAPEGVFLS